MWKIIKGLPENIVGALNPGQFFVLDIKNVSSCPTPRLLLIFMTVVENPSTNLDIMEGKEPTEDVSRDGPPRTIFYELPNSDLPAEEKGLIA
jgi:hypothetical protein